MTGSRWRVGALTLASVFVLVACAKRRPSSGDAGAGDAGAGDAGAGGATIMAEAAAPSALGAVEAGAAALGGPCKSVYSDCPKVRAGCNVTCANYKSSASSSFEGYCTLREVTAVGGDVTDPCRGPSRR